MSLPEITNYFAIVLSVVIFYIFKFYNSKIANYFNLIDKPKKNKIHKNPTPVTASLPIFVIFMVCNINYLIYGDINKEIIFIFLSGIFGFILGLLDDKINLDYKIKFFAFIVFIILIIQNSDNLVLNKIYFETFDKTFFLNDFESLILTVLCLLLLINATNLSDGINGLCLGISIIWLAYIAFKFNSYLNLIPIIIVGCFCFVYNLRGFFFLGNSGSHFFGIFTGMLVIFLYNNNLNIDPSLNNISVEEIFIVLMLPGIDMLRLFVIRIYNHKNPFSSDLLHLHHFLIKRFNLIPSLIIYLSSIILPIVVYNLEFLNAYLLILLFITYYLFLLKFLTK